jgi:Cu+-exporting ATPase
VSGMRSAPARPPAAATAPGGPAIELAIQGMTCAACAVRVERKLNRIGQVRATVSLATERATITAPPGVTAADLISAVQAAGYGAALIEPLAGPPGAGAGPDQAAYLRRRLILALVFFVPLSDLSVQLSLFPGFRFPGWPWVLTALAAPVAVWAAWPFHRAALINARHGAASMDTLVSLGITASCGWSLYAMFVLDRGRAGSALHELTRAAGGGIYLEVAAGVTTFLLAGRYFEARARRTAGQAMRELAAAGAGQASLLAADGTERRVPVTGLVPGDMFVVRPGEKIAADGTVLFGESAVDRAMMTGESIPAEVTEGDEVTGGTIALTGRLVVRAVRVGADTQLAAMIALVERAQADKAAVQRLADRISGAFVPAVLVLAAATLAGWLLAGSPAEHAFSAGLAVLIIACPCALGLATPAALVVACGRGAQLGIFIKGYQALESSRSVDTVVLDKTGTITTGQMRVTATATAAGTSPAELLALAGAVEQASEHAVAAAISAAARAAGTAPAPVTGFRALPGLGARGLVDGREIVVGRARLLRDRGLPVPAGLQEKCTAWERGGATTVLAAWDGQARGGFAIADAVRASAPGAVAELRRLGLRPVLLTGDSEPAARSVAAATGIDEVVAGVLPGQKAAYIAGLQARGHAVAMVGDGVNDGPALARASLGIAVGSGTDVAICAADLILLRDDLQVVPDAIRLSRATFATIRRSLIWAFGYNVIAIPLAAAGWLNPLIAAGAMTLSSAFVVASSLRLRRFQPGAASRPAARRSGVRAGAPRGSRYRYRRPGPQGAGAQTEGADGGLTR